METVVLFDPGIRSLNKGDEIIMKSAERELDKRGLLDNRYVIRSATHAPIVTWYQNSRRNPRMRVYDEAKYKFICGSNLMWKNMMKPRPTFNVDLTNCRPYRNSIFMGIGIGQANSKVNWYTKELYHKILSKEFVHSTRDARAAEFLKGLGYQTIDTGCPTMWQFTPEFCQGIPRKKAQDVIFTLTDYVRDKQYDQQLIDILTREYRNVYFWIQGIFDKEYFDSFDHTENIHIIAPTLEAYSKVLQQDDIEYVGTRLHAAMFAMQHQKRAIILAIDNRVRDMSETYELHTLERNDISQLPQMINASFLTDIKLKQGNIDKWLAQFEVAAK